MADHLATPSDGATDLSTWRAPDRRICRGRMGEDGGGGMLAVESKWKRLPGEEKPVLVALPTLGDNTYERNWVDLFSLMEGKKDIDDDGPPPYPFYESIEATRTAMKYRRRQSIIGVTLAVLLVVTVIHVLCRGKESVGSIPQEALPILPPQKDNRPDDPAGKPLLSTGTGSVSRERCAPPDPPAHVSTNTPSRAHTNAPTPNLPPTPRSVRPLADEPDLFSAAERISPRRHTSPLPCDSPIVSCHTIDSPVRITGFTQQDDHITSPVTSDSRVLTGGSVCADPDANVETYSYRITDRDCQNLSHSSVTTRLSHHE